MIGGLGQTILKRIRAQIPINFNTGLHSVTGIHAVGIKKEKKGVTYEKKTNDAELPNKQHLFNYKVKFKRNCKLFKLFLIII
jgi:hypothetical protein